MRKLLKGWRMILDPIDSQALAPAIDKAVQAGIPVICFEADSPDSIRLSHIGTVHYQAGALMGEVVEKLLQGRGMLLVEGGQLRSDNDKQRLEGFLQYIRKRTDMKVVDIRHHDGSSEQALADLEAMIDAHPHFDALVSMDWIAGSTSVLVWKAKGLNRDSITFGMTPKIQEAIRNGQISSVVSQNEQDSGRLLVESLWNAYRK